MRPKAPQNSVADNGPSFEETDIMKFLFSKKALAFGEIHGLANLTDRPCGRFVQQVFIEEWSPPDLTGRGGNDIRIDLRAIAPLGGTRIDFFCKPKL